MNGSIRQRGLCHGFAERDRRRTSHPASPPPRSHRFHPLNGADKGELTLEGLVGVSYGFAVGFDLRAGYMFPITSPKEFDQGFTAGVILHF